RDLRPGRGASPRRAAAGPGATVHAHRGRCGAGRGARAAGQRNDRRDLQQGGPPVSSNKPKKAPTGDYAVGYARPPKGTQFQPGQSGNSAGRPRGRPSLDELLLEEAARVVKFQAGDKVMHMDRDRALMRKLFDMALVGKVQAIQLVIARLSQAQA